MGNIDDKHSFCRPFFKFREPSNIMAILLKEFSVRFAIGIICFGLYYTALALHLLNHNNMITIWVILFTGIFSNLIIKSFKLI